MTLQLNKISDAHTNLINSEGKILGLYVDNATGDLYLRGNTSASGVQILCRTNSFRFGLYLASRISLVELFHLSYDEMYLFQKKAATEARFLEVEDLEAPRILSSLEYSNSLYSLINEKCRSELTTDELIDILPVPKNQSICKKLGSMEISAGMWNFSITDNDSLNLVSIEDEVFNPHNHDYVQSYSKKTKTVVYTKTNPVALKLFLTSRITVSELLKCYLHEMYIIHDDSRYQLTGYSEEVRKIIESVKFARRIHSTLPKKLKFNSIDQLKIYASYTINGRGSVPAEFERNKVIDLVIDD